jgi:hypothetical protein
MRIRVAPPARSLAIPIVDQFTGWIAGVFSPLAMTRHSVRHAYDEDDTRAAAGVEATIGWAGGGRNRIGVECYWETVKCRFCGVKSELRFKFRHKQSVSDRVLRRVGGLAGLALQELELPRNGIGPEIKV